jgi:hypothetical protein
MARRIFMGTNGADDDGRRAVAIYLKREPPVCSRHDCPAVAHLGCGPRSVIRPLATDDEARVCAEIMSTTEPWLTFGRSFQQSLEILRDPAREVYVALDAPEGVAPRWGIRDPGHGWRLRRLHPSPSPSAMPGEVAAVGTALIAFAERRILRETPNVFICVSSFNPALGVSTNAWGTKSWASLLDYMVRGHSEILLRKTNGPLAVHREYQSRGRPELPGEHRRREDLLWWHRGSWCSATRNGGTQSALNAQTSQKTATSNASSFCVFLRVRALCVE